MGVKYHENTSNLTYYGNSWHGLRVMFEMDEKTKKTTTKNTDESMDRPWHRGTLWSWRGKGVKYDLIINDFILFTLVG